MNPYHALLLSIVASVFGQILLKLGATKMVNKPSNLFAIFFELEILAGLTFYIIGFLFYVSAIRNLPLSIAYPTVSAGYVAVVLAGVFVFGEKLVLIQILGLALILIGIYLLWR